MTDLKRKDILSLHRMIEESGLIVTVSHTHPDGDAVGSSLALARWLTSLGKQAISIFPDPINDSLAFLPLEDSVIIHSENPSAAEEAVQKADLLICLDFNSFSRVEALAPTLGGAKCRKVLIDHHINPDRPSFDLCFSETEISSASELLFWILMEMPENEGDANKLPGGSADALMAGMTTDTNNFANSVWPSTFNMASMLLGAGVDRDGILSRILQSYRENRLRLLGHILQDLMVTTPEGAAWFILDRDTILRYDVREGETEGFVNIPLTAGSVRMSVFLKQENGLFRVSVRSKKGTSANAFAIKYFHGGGHENAAGGKLYFPGDIAEPSGAAAYLEKAIKEFLG